MSAMSLSCAPLQPWLQRVNPLTKSLAALPAMVALIFARSWQFPGCMIVVALAVLAIGARLRVRSWVLLASALPVFICVFALIFALWVDPRFHANSPRYWSAGNWLLTEASIAIGLATALRLAALVLLAFVIGVSTTARQLVLALITHLHLPYRAGYAILIGVRFVPKIRQDLQMLRLARQVRGVGGPPWRTWASYLVPLASGVLRHAGRVALAMDARGFGSYAQRTERDALQWSSKDALIVAASWCLTGTCAAWGSSLVWNLTQ